MILCRATLFEEEVARCRRPFEHAGGDLNRIRDRLQRLMWDDVGIVRHRAGLERAVAALDALAAELSETGVAETSPVFNLTWHDWLDLESLIAVSRVIAHAALVRADSRGAHFREDFPETGALETSAYTVVRRAGDALDCGTEPVHFSIVKPGESLIDDAARTTAAHQEREP